MPVSNALCHLALPASVLLVAGLAGCSGTTYGTGISPEKQTFQDVLSIGALSAPQKAPIDYRPRGGIVVPPTDSLPIPGTDADSADRTASVSADPNWPKDPDEAKRAEAAAKAARSDSIVPNFILPKGQTSYSVASAESTPQTRAEGKKAWDELHKGKAGSTDANGNPVRKYLTEPPVAYREPDPNAPMTEPPKTKKKWNFDVSKLWPW